MKKQDEFDMYDGEENIYDENKNDATYDFENDDDGKNLDNNKDSSDNEENEKEEILQVVFF